MIRVRELARARNSNTAKKGTILDRLEGKSKGAERDKAGELNIPELYQCVHCGLCLNQCPTYRALRLEPESPRGRIHLVKAAAEGRIELNERFKEHLYLCLLCRACETACPSGVQYSHIAETARAQLGPTGSLLFRSIQKFAFTQMLPYPERLRLAARLLRIYQHIGLQNLVRSLLPESIRDMDSLLPRIPDRFLTLLQELSRRSANSGLRSRF